MAEAPQFTLPNVIFHVMSDSGPAAMTSHQIFMGKSVVLFGMPGAFTPYCDGMHLPGILEDYDEIKSHGADIIACTTVNDIYVLDVWAKKYNANTKILFLADGNGDFARALDLLADERHQDFGFRSKRYTMWVLKGVVQYLKINDDASTAHAATLSTLVNVFRTWNIKPSSSAIEV